MKKYIHKLIVTSPKYLELFYDEHFNGETLVLENMPIKNMMPDIKPHNHSDRLRIGIVGGLNRGAPTKLLLEYCKGMRGVEIRIYGRGVEEPLIKEYAEKNENIHFYGGYNYSEEISDIYSNIDLIYSVYDTNTTSLNTKFALPNKLYESMYYKVPIIVSKGTYLEERVKSLNIGYSMNCDSTSELDSIITLSINGDSNLTFDLVRSNDYLGDAFFPKFKAFVLKG